MEPFNLAYSRLFVIPHCNLYTLDRYFLHLLFALLIAVQLAARRLSTFAIDTCPRPHQVSSAVVLDSRSIVALYR